MIDRDEFLKMMAEISEQKERDEAFSSVLSYCCDHIVHLNDNKNLDAFLMLAKETIDPDEWINWFYFDNSKSSMTGKRSLWIRLKNYMII